MYFIDYAITVVPFSPLYSPPPCTPPPLVHVHGSYIRVLWLLHFLYCSYPPPVYFLPTIYATYSLYLFPFSPAPTPLLITLHVISISVILSCSSCLLSLFWGIFLGSVVNTYEFVVILLFIFLIFFFLDKSFEHFI